MPQELRVVCCFQCRKFQSDIVKKAKKWTCKLCGAKQSLVKEYARGSGRECRLLVQQLSEGTLQADQFERDVAERVLEGKIELPNAVGNAIRDESERLMASHGQGSARKVEDGNSSKWVSFCSRDDDGEVGDLMEGKDVKIPSKSKVVGERESVKSKNFTNFTPRKAYEPSPTPSLMPLADFHQMNKQDKELKWQSNLVRETNANQLSSPIRVTSSSTAGLKQPLFSFKPKLCKQTTGDVQEIERINTVTQKRASNEECPRDKQAPIMSFAKKSKWSSFKLKETDSNASDLPNINEPSQCPNELVSTSKWSKFVTAANEEDDEFS
nr:MRN complex-interacting protein-like [Aedes albopictus]